MIFCHKFIHSCVITLCRDVRVHTLKFTNYSTKSGGPCPPSPVHPVSSDSAMITIMWKPLGAYHENLSPAGSGSVRTLASTCTRTCRRKPLGYAQLCCGRVSQDLDFFLSTQPGQISPSINPAITAFITSCQIWITVVSWPSAWSPISRNLGFN